MTVDDKIKDEKLQYNTQHYHQIKSINMNILQAKKYCHLIKVE